MSTIEAVSSKTDSISQAVDTLQQVASVVNPPALIEQAQNMQNLIGRRMTRMVSTSVSSAGLFAQAFAQPNTWQELAQMQQAIGKRLQQQQQDWQTGCLALAKDYAQIKRANTVSKLAEQQFNLVAQWGQLINSQLVSLMGLQETIEVDYGYWVSEKVQQN